MTSNELETQQPQVHAIRIYHLGGLLWLRSWRVWRANREMDHMLRTGWSVMGALAVGSSCLIVHYINREVSASMAYAAALLAAQAQVGAATENQEDDDKGWGVS